MLYVYRCMFWKGLLVRTDDGRGLGEHPRGEEVTVHAAFPSGDPALFSLDSEFVQGHSDLDRGVLAELVGVLIADHRRRHVFAFVLAERLNGSVRFCEDGLQLVNGGNFLFMLAVPVFKGTTLFWRQSEGLQTIHLKDQLHLRPELPCIEGLKRIKIDFADRNGPPAAVAGGINQIAVIVYGSDKSGAAQDFDGGSGIREAVLVHFLRDEPFQIGGIGAFERAVQFADFRDPCAGGLNDGILVFGVDQRAFLEESHCHLAGKHGLADALGAGQDKRTVRPEGAVHGVLLQRETLAEPFADQSAGELVGRIKVEHGVDLIQPVHAVPFNILKEIQNGIIFVPAGDDAEKILNKGTGAAKFRFDTVMNQNARLFRSKLRGVEVVRIEAENFNRVVQDIPPDGDPLDCQERFKVAQRKLRAGCFFRLFKGQRLAVVVGFVDLLGCLPVAAVDEKLIHTGDRDLCFRTSLDKTAIPGSGGSIVFAEPFQSSLALVESKQEFSSLSYG